MDVKTLQTLEFHKVLKRLAGFTQNEKVQARILSLVPETDIARARSLQKETTEAVGVLLRRGTPPGFSVSDVSGAIMRTERGGAMSMAEFLKLANALAVSRRLKAYITEDKPGEGTYIRSLADSIENLKQVETEIGDKIIGEDEMADGASPALFAIRKSIKTHASKVRDTLNSYITSTKVQKFLQESIVTMRGDRYVIPVKAEHKGEIKGIVHDASSSGSTVFIEPASVVELTNEIAALKAKEKEEMDRILYELSGFVSEFKDPILANYNTIFELDFIFCKGRLSLEDKAVEPELNQDGVIVIKHGRHPLLDKNKVVPIDISLGETYDTLVITGPNTGGKTVSLKTLGLFTLMAQSGLHISAASGSKIAVFDNVFADIGDEQSIEQSLSTFSSHIVKLVNILETVTKNSLVLTDELGAGTDPQEGAALAVSIIEYLRNFGARVAATTHYSELKMYALSTEGVENASCEFDVATLSPTYKLMIGVPGKSNAFAISRKLGMNASVIEHAKQRIGAENVKLEDVIASLEENRRKAEEDRALAENASRDARIFKENMKKERERLEANKAKILQEARAEALTILESAKEQSQELMRELREIKSSAAYKEAMEKSERAKELLRKEAEKLKEQAASGKPKVRTLKNVKLGETVHVVSMNLDASVLSEPDKKGNLFVQAGIMKIKTNLNDLTKAAPPKEKKTAPKTNTASFKTSKQTTATMETDVRGMTLDEAILVVDKFIDDCYLASLHEVTIIHGKGTGVLRQGIGEFLRRHPTVSSYRAGRYGEGEAGVTVVTLKDK